MRLSNITIHDVINLYRDQLGHSLMKKMEKRHNV